MDRTISVIIPCFNSAKFIERCLESILNQTYQNLEILVVDDGSTDDSANVIQKIAKRDSRVKYIYQPNSGVSAARNKGIECASGELVTFVDSDDTIAQEMYQVLTELLERHDADISHCSYLRDENGVKKYVGDTKQIYLFEGEQVAESLLKAELFTPSCWNKLFRKEVLQNVWFDSRFKINEDLLFDFYAFKNAKRAVFIDRCLYTYHVEETSSCNNTSFEKKTMDCYTVSKEILKHSIGKTYEHIAKERFLHQEIFLYWFYINNPSQENKVKAKQQRKKIVNALERDEFSMSTKKKAALIRYAPFLYKPLMNIYDKLRKPNWDV